MTDNSFNPGKHLFSLVFLAAFLVIPSVPAQTLLYQWTFDNAIGNGPSLTAAPSFIDASMTGGVLNNLNAGPGLSALAGSGVYGWITASDLGRVDSTAYRSTSGVLGTGVGDLSSISAFTVGLWFKLNGSVTSFSSLNGGALLSRLVNIATTAAGDGDELYFALNTGNALQFGVNRANTGTISANNVFGTVGTSPATMTNQWIFVAASYITASGGTVKLYTGTTNSTATLVSTLTSVGNIAWSATTNFIFIGNNGGGQRSLPGAVDNVNFYNTALTLAQIQTLQTNAAPNSDLPVAGTPTIFPAGTIYQGSSITVTSVVTGASPLYFQWRTDGGGGALTNISGATNPSLTTTPLAIGDIRYDLVVTNSHGSVTSAVATVTVVAAPGTANVTVNVASNLNMVASTAYGIHASIYANQLGNSGLANQVLQSGVKTIRYPGGGLADVFHWSVSRPALGSLNGYGLSPWFGVANSFGYMGPKTDFGSFAQLLANGTFQAVITINYGSGLKYGGAGRTNLVVPTTNAEPAEAAAWVAYANSSTNIYGTANDVTLGVDSQGNDWKTAGYWAMMRAAAPLGVDDGYNFLRIHRTAPLGIKHWEIGNETFGTGYYDSGGSDGYSVNYAVPYPNGTFTRYGNTNLSPAAYGRGVKAFSLRMKAVDPTIKIGAVVSTPPGDYSWDSFGGQRWTPQVFAQCATNMDFVVAHWYPYAGNLADGSGLLAQVDMTLPAMINGTGSHTGTSSGLRDWINAARADGTNVDIFMTEFGYTGSVTNALNGQPIFGPVNALYAGDTYATWIELGVANVDWLELTKNTFLGDSNPLVPGAAYYAAQLNYRMADSGDTLVKTTSDLSRLRAHAAVRQDGKLGLMLLNQNAASNLVVNVTVANTNLSTAGIKYEFGTNNFSGITQTPFSAPSSNLVSGLGNSFSVTVPAYTVVVLTIPFTAPPVPTNTPPLLADIGNFTVNVGQTVAFTASATDTDSPPQTVTFTLLSGATNVTLDANTGVFSWRPMVSDANTTNSFSLMASDNGSPSLSATQNFQIRVNPLTLPSLANASFANGHFSLTISGMAGPDYEIQSSTNLVDWGVAFVTNSPSMPFNWTDASTNLLQQFYRVIVGPL